MKKSWKSWAAFAVVPSIGACATKKATSARRYIPIWRFQRQNYFDAWDLENASSTQLIKPFRRGCWFVKDKDYNAYNTLACVGNLKKSMQEGDMMTDAEILALQQNTQDSNMDGVVNPSRRWLRKRKAAK